MNIGHYFHGVLASPDPSLFGSAEGVQVVGLPHIVNIRDIDGDTDKRFGERVKMELMDVLDEYLGIVLEFDDELVRRAAMVMNKAQILKYPEPLPVQLTIQTHLRSPGTGCLMGEN